MDPQHRKIQPIYEWQDAPQPIVHHHGRQAGSIKRVRRKKRTKSAKFEKELYICKEYSLAGVNHDRANGSRYVFGEYSVLGDRLKGLEHPNIINYVDFSYNPQSQVAKLYTEYCKDGDLEQLLHRNKKTLSTREGLSVLYQISRGLLYLHHGVYCADDVVKLAILPGPTSGKEASSDWTPILHRDIKPPNIFVAGYTVDCIQVKLGDFGIAKAETIGTDTYIGSRSYHAPEQRMDFQGPGNRRTTIKSDIYALGMTMQQTIQSETNGDSNLDDSIRDTAGTTDVATMVLHQTIKKCLDADDYQRPCSGTIVDDLSQYVKPERTQPLASKVFSTIIISTTGLAKSGNRLQKAEARSLAPLSRRCLQSGSKPDQDTIRGIQRYIQLGSTPDWQADALRDILPMLADTLSPQIRPDTHNCFESERGLQTELVTQEEKLIDTKAGTMVNEEAIRAEKQYQAELIQIRKEIYEARAAHDHDIQEALEQSKKEYEGKLDKVLDVQELLRYEQRNVLPMAAPESPSHPLPELQLNNELSTLPSSLDEPMGSSATSITPQTAKQARTPTVNVISGKYSGRPQITFGNLDTERSPLLGSFDEPTSSTATSIAPQTAKQARASMVNVSSAKGSGIHSSRPQITFGEFPGLHEVVKQEAMQHGHSSATALDVLHSPKNTLTGSPEFHPSAQSQASSSGKSGLVQHGLPGAEFKENQQPQLAIPAMIFDSGLQQQEPPAVQEARDAFKQFANQEKLRIKQAQEAKRNNVRQDKAVKLNDLKKFAATFQLTTRVPDDLVPLLAKDFEKQMKIQKKAEQASKEAEDKRLEREIEEMEAKYAAEEKEEEERKRAYQEKKGKEKVSRA